MMVPRKPRVVVVGAGMAGISAAHRLQQVQGSSFHLTLLEASHKIGGRICTSQFGGDRIELGATWIHGVEGSPLYEIADRIGAFKGHDAGPYERQDVSLQEPIIRAEGGVRVDPALLQPVKDLYKDMMLQIRGNGLQEIQRIEQFKSIGAFVKQGFATFCSQQGTVTSVQNSNSTGLDEEGLGLHGWNLSSLQNAALSMHECMERVTTSANSLFDLDLELEKEYIEYPGAHVTIPKGYDSVVDELASGLPANAIQFGRKVHKIMWGGNSSTCHSSSGLNSAVLVQCDDGSLFEADHVIITVSLGVLKVGVLKTHDSNCNDERPVGRSIYDSLPNEEIDTARLLFEPPLPPRKVEAISRLGYGVVDKLFMLLKPSGAAYHDELHSHLQLLYKSLDDPHGCENNMEGMIPWWMRKTVSIAPIYKGSNVLLCWFAGKEALEMEGLSEEEIVGALEKTLASFGVACRDASYEHGGKCMASKLDIHIVREEEDYKTVKQSISVLEGEEKHHKHYNHSSHVETEEEHIINEATKTGNGENIMSNCNANYIESDQFDGDLFKGVMRSQWGRDPLFRGSYSYAATGATGEDFEALAAPLPTNPTGHDGETPLQLLFAGEATHRHLYSTTHGAHLSGLREANRLLQHYGYLSCQVHDNN